ncbi:MAG: Fur family transcriptional regulator [Armatimonadota bacterium]|nr:Fur family transcriptional regulator [Armatimonadota bacterium]
MSKHTNESALASKLADKGIRLTRQRRTLLDIIETSQGHLHASDLLTLAREQDERIDRATVYRTLSLLKGQGLVEELDLLHLDGSEHHYELKAQTSHVHIGCKGCGRIFEFQSELVKELESAVRRETGCAVESVRVEVAAWCPECRKRQ